MLFPIAALIFLAVFCVLVAIYLGVAEVQASPRSELKRRLRQMAGKGQRDLPEGLASEITRETAPLDRLLSRLPLTRGLDRKLDHAGLHLSVTAFVAITLALALAFAAVAVFATKRAISGLPAAAVAHLFTLIFLRVRTLRRVDRFTEFFPEALTMIARSLRAGHSFNTSIQLVGQEIPDPVGELFKTAYDQQMLGLRITDGLTNLNERIESLDLRFFTTIVSINTEIGGNLAEVLEKLALTIRERLRIRRQVRVYTAQGRMSGYVLGALPVVAFILFNIMNPAYESALVKEPLGIYALVLAGCLQLMGLLVIRQIIKIKI